MFPEYILDCIAVNVVSTWLLQRGILPSGGWDPNDPNCVRNYGPHRVWTVQGKISEKQAETLNLEELESAFREYLDKHNKLPTAVRFQPYKIEAYSYPGTGTFLFVSIYHG